MAKQERKRLNINVDKLLPGESFPIGDEQVIIRPLGLRKIKEISCNLQALWNELKEKGITFTNTAKEIPAVGDDAPTSIIIPPNFKEPENLLIISQILVTKFVGVLEEVSDIHQDDLDELPIDIIVGLVAKCIEVNLKSKESLLGNFKSLTGILVKMGLLEKAKTEENDDQKTTPSQK